MAKKKKSAGGLGADVDNDDEKGGGFAGFLLAVLIIIIWLVIFALLIKMDVGGIGTMLRPVLKNVPVVSNILPEMSDEELMEDFLPEKGSLRERKLVNVPDHVTEAYPPVYLMTCVGDFCKPQAPLLEKALKEKHVYYEYVIYGDEENPLYHVFHVTIQEPMGQKCNDEECGFFRRMMN